MNKFIKFSAKEEYKTPLCEVLDDVFSTDLCTGSTNEPFTDNSNWEGIEGWA